MADKFFDENGFDQDGYDRNGYNAYGELNPLMDMFNMDKEDIRNVCKSIHGRRLIWRILSFCGVFEDSEPGLNSDFLREQVGKRRTGLYIMGILNEADPAILLNIMNENFIKEKEKDNARRNYRL